LHYRRKEYDEALPLYKLAYQLNPLHRSLRDSARNAHVALARRYAEARNIERARAEFQAAVGLGDPCDLISVYCKWAAAEFNAGDKQQAEEHVQRALTESKHPLPVAYYMVTEVGRYKLKGKIKTRFDKEFKSALAAAPSPAAIATILPMASALRGTNTSYQGQQAHEKKLLAQLRSIPPEEFNEPLLVEIVHALVGLQATTPLRSLITFGKRHYPCSPWFPYIEAENYFSLGPDRCPVNKVTALLEKAERLAHGLPPAPSKEALLGAIEGRKKMLAIISPDFMDSLAREFGNMFGGFEEEGDGGALDEEEWDDEEDGEGFFIPPPFRGRRRKQRKGR
jgi:tetratricopeptide (TPR) repeat protein